MQLIRTIGLEFGSYKHVFRRKISELLYSNLVFNSYIKQLSVDSGTRKNIRYWILANYIGNVSVKFGIRELYPDPKCNKSTIELLYNRTLDEITEEEFLYGA